MTHDILLACAPPDTARAEEVASALERHGFAVYVDISESLSVLRDAPPDLPHPAKTIIVLWSSHSIGSSRVLWAAESGQREEKLVPVHIERVASPDEFASLNTVDLVDWDASTDSIAFRQLVAQVEKILKAKNPRPHPRVSTVAAPVSGWAYLFAVLGAALLAYAAWSLGSDPGPLSWPTLSGRAKDAALALGLVLCGAGLTLIVLHEILTVILVFRLRRAIGGRPAHGGAP